MNIEYISHYDYFPNHHPKTGEPYITCYNDNFVTHETKPNSIAMLIEPRSIQPNIYRYMEEEGYKKFRYIFTHDSVLLGLFGNARWVTNMGVWDWSDEPKTKFCSMISSNKVMCDLHKQRKELAFRLENKIDCFGTYNGGERVETCPAHAPYMYAVVIENYIDDFWYTEKILNCFANKTIPIYYGARKIGLDFNRYGIIQVNSIDEIEKFIDACLKTGYGEYYYNRPYVQEAIADNYERVKEYSNFESWFMKKYEGLLNDLYSETQRI